MLKSEIMIMKKGGGRRRNDEKWSLNDNNVNVCKKYKYLGVEIIPSLKIVDHLKGRVSAAKVNMNMVWSQFVRRNDVSMNDKMCMFDAVARAIACYTCQVWGYQEYEELERLKRWFVKRVLCLPKELPNYALELECGMEPLFMYTLRCHISYVKKVMYEYEDKRLQKILLRSDIDNGIEWVNVWENRMIKHGMNWNWNASKDLFVESTNEMIKKEVEWRRSMNVERARATTTHGLFCDLQYVNGGAYLKTDLTAYKKGIIMRARCGVIRVNASIWREGEARMCSICNYGEEESIQHLLGRCPAWRELRRYFFGMNELNRDKCIDVLNGYDWDKLYGYLSMVMKLRSEWIREYNH